MLKSGILLQHDVPFENWTKLLSLIFELANNKPWLRKECGYIVYCSISDISMRKADAKYVEEILSCLCKHNLAKTPEGVAIWLAAMDSPTSVKFPPNVWQHGSPIHVREKAKLAKIMRESSDSQTPAENSHKPAVWNPQLHFAWEAILPRLYAQEPSIFADIWTEVVDSKFGITTTTLVMSLYLTRECCRWPIFSRIFRRAQVLGLPTLHQGPK